MNPSMTFVPSVVFRRIGGLEIDWEAHFTVDHVFRRIGGLENGIATFACLAEVFRRIGGLEMPDELEEC